MKRLIGSAVCILLTGFFVTVAYSAAGDSATGLKGDNAAPQTVQGKQEVQPPTEKLSKRNKAKIKQAEAAKARNEKVKSKLSKRNQARIRQSEAAKKMHGIVEDTNAAKTK